MGYNNNSFPVFLSARTDGTFEVTVRKFEDFVGTAMKNVAGKATEASSIIERQFNFKGASNQLAQFEKGALAALERISRGANDALGVSRSLSGLKTSPFDAGLREQQAAENALDAQRQKASAARVKLTSDEFNAAIRGIQEEKAARESALTEGLAQAKANAAAFIALDNQRIEASKQAARELQAAQAKAVSGREFIQAPGFDPQAATAAAAGARAHAAALRDLAEVAGRVAAAEGTATATDKAFAAQMLKSASAADIEASRLEELAATQLRVAGAAKAGAAGFDAANLQLQTGVRNTRFAALQASQQFQDFFIQIQGGQNPMVAFSQQASQLAFVMSQSGGEAGKLARFFSGPWGTGVFIALAALTPFVSKLFETDDATKKATKSLEDQVKELGDNARASRTAEVAQSLFATSAEGAAKAIAEVTKELEKQNTSLENNAKLKRGGIELNIASITSGIGTKQEEVVKAEATLASARGQVQAATRLRESGERGAGAYLADANAKFKEAQKEVFRLKSELLGLQDALNKAGQAVDRVDIGEISRRAENALDPVKAINDRYEEMARAAREAAVGNAKLKSSLDDTLGSIYKQRDADLERAKAAKKVSDASTTALPPVTRGEVANALGAPIRSGYRSKAQNDAVDGAANSYHLGGPKAAIQAIDIPLSVNGKPLSKAGIREALAPLGVEIKELLGPGDKDHNDHFHIAFARKRQGPDQVAKSEQRESDKARRVAEAAVAEQERLQTIYERSAEKVADINARFDAQPRLVDQAANAVRDLDAIITNLGKEKPPGFAQLIADAQAAKPIIQEGLTRPLREMVETSNQQAQVDALVLAGRQDQADVMVEINRLQAQMGLLSAQEVEAVENIVRADRLRSRALAENEKAIQRQVDAAEGLQDAITGIIANPTDLNSFKDAFEQVFSDFQQQWAERISQSLFGNLGQEVEDSLRMKADPLGVAGDQLNKSALELGESAVELINAALVIRQQAAAGPSIEQIATTPTAFGGSDAFNKAFADIAAPGSAFDRAFANLIPANDDGGLGGVGGVGGAVVGAVDAQTRLAQRRFELEKQNELVSNPVAYYNKFGAVVGGKLDKALGTGIFGKIGGKLGTVLEGVQLGGIGGGIADMLGLKTSKLGSSIGGAIGNAILPGIGGIVGGFLGGIVGGLFKKTKTGSATIGGNEFGSLDVTGTSGNNSDRKEAAKKAAGAVLDPLEDLAGRLGVIMDELAGKVSIGIRKDAFKVDPTGAGRTKGAGVVDFGEDQQAAVEFAMRNLIEDGVLGPIRDGTKKLLLNSRTLANGIEKALKFEDVFKRLARYTDPVAAAIAELNVEFDGLRKVFNEAGASAQEYAQLEALYAFERAEAVKQAAKDMTSSLKALLDELTYKGDTGLSLRTREKNALSAFQPFEQQIGAGQAIDQEAFADVATSLLAIQREIYGSTSAYFDSLNNVTALTRQAINTAGGAVTVPGILTPTSGTVQAPAIAGAPTATGFSTTAPGGVLASAANDNARAAALVVAAIKEQTTLISPLLSQTALVGAIQTAMTGLQARVDPNGGATIYELKNVTKVIQDGNSRTIKMFADLIDVTAENGERITSARASAGSGNDFGPPGFNIPSTRLGLSTGYGPAGFSYAPISATQENRLVSGSRFASGGG